jgi:Ran GTPase-activating protein (RanGAP) involved in mRNA processing and transport
MTVVVTILVHRPERTVTTDPFGSQRVGLVVWICDEKEWRYHRGWDHGSQNWLHLTTLLQQLDASAIHVATAFNGSGQQAVAWEQHVQDLVQHLEAAFANEAAPSLSNAPNNIDNAGAAALGDVLTSNTTLTCLNLVMNKIGNEGAVALGDALTSNTTLTYLGLCVNNIGNEGAVALAEALKGNTSLTELRLDNNAIGEEGASSFKSVLKKCNTTLTGLHIHRNFNISEATRSAIAALVKANEAGIRLLHAGAELDLSSKRINRAKARHIALELADNTTVTRLRIELAVKAAPILLTPWSRIVS